MSAEGASTDFALRPPSSGWAWIRRSFAMFMRQPLRWIALVMVFWVIVIVMHRIPAIGALAFYLLKPVFEVGFLAAAWHQERGQAPQLKHLFAGFRASVLTLVAIGAFFLFGIFAALLLAAMVDGGSLLGVFMSDRGAEALGAGPPSVLAVLIAAVASVPVVLAKWFAPAIVVFRDARAPAALATSLRASLANWRALIVFCLAIIAIMTVLMMIFRALGGLIGDREAFLIVAPVSLAIGAVTSISDYVSYRDIFHHDE